MVIRPILRRNQVFGLLLAGLTAAQAAAADTAIRDLTPHEQRVLKMFAEGHNYKTAAAELGVTVNTVAFHVKQIYGKLEVHSKSEAVVKAIRSGLIEL